MKQPSLPQHIGPADVCSPPFSPPKSANLAAQRSVEVPAMLKAGAAETTPDLVPVRCVLFPLPEISPGYHRAV
jgi:hypothetical protein